MRQTKILKTEHLGKPLIPSAGLSVDWDRRVQALMKKMYLETKRELTAAFKETDFKGAMDASPVSQSRIILNALMSKYEKLFNTLSKSIVDKMISSVMRNSGATLKMSLEGYVNPLEIDRTATNARLKEIIQASSEEAANLIKRIPEKYLGEVQGQVMRSITSGKGLNELVPYLTEKYKGDARWAKHVALDQTRKTYTSVNTARLQQCGVDKFKWIHSGGSNQPRKHHIELSGKIFRFDDLPVIDPRTGQKGMPAMLPFCHPYESKVETTNGLMKLYRRRYSGELITLVTDDGEIFKATVNHPVLTSNGWKAIKSINVGDYIISTRNQSVNRFKNEIQNSATTIGNLFDSAALNIGVTSSNACSSNLQFHGDMSDGEVDVIDIDGFLLQEADSSFCKYIVELFLSVTKYSTRLSNIESFSSADQTIMRALGAPECIVSSLCSGLALFRSHLSHANNTSHALRSNFAFPLSYDSSDDRSRYAVTFGKLKLANASTIESANIAIRELYAIVGRAFDLGDFEAPQAQLLGKIVGVTSDFSGDFAKPETFTKKLNCVVKISKDFFSDHVYNLQTSREWFTSEGIITHNCRCSYVPVFFDSD